MQNLLLVSDKDFGIHFIFFPNLLKGNTLPYVNLFNQYLLRHLQISVADSAFIASFFRKEVLKAGDYFVRQGNACAKLAFVADGVLKTYYTTYSNQESIRYFSEKQQWVGHLESFVGQKVAPNSVIAVLECHLVTITYHSFQQLQRDFSLMSALPEKIREETTSASVNLYKDIQDYKARYEEFIRSEPELAFQLSTEDIAGYLHIPHEKLLRILCETLFFF
ncbi:Crp/Fnr family transcriptional regulator [Runella sp.]|uniref:Crp/Fnr family transcriptional regulator n=1 Tax=Runella sp. TaxID=1960881 RepID=UPI003D0E8D88